MTVFKVGPYVGAAASTRTRLHARRVKRGRRAFFGSVMKFSRVTPGGTTGRDAQGKSQRVETVETTVGGRAGLNS